MEAARPKVTPLTRPTRTRSHVPPLGVRPTPDGGIDVAVLASHAHGVELCLVDVVDPDKDQHDPERYTERRITLDGPTYGVWHGHVANVSPGQRYGFRVHGPWDPGAGMRHNPAKLLLDPYARGIEGEVAYVPATLGGGAGDDGGPDEQDSLPYVPHAVVMPAEQGPRSSQRPRVPWADTVVYEAHVRGLTLLHPEVPEELRGTYAGLAHPAVIEHLTSLGVTTLELLPIHASTAEPWLAGRGLTNYWGYSTMGFFAPHPAYATAAAREAGPAAVLDEVRGMVHLLHEAGIEVILDVVYNHTCEGGDDALHLSWRGLDNTLYYLHDGGTPARLADVTGTGNTLDFRRTRVVQMALDSLRYWAEVVGVDGYRFDLAVTLGRDHDGYNPDHPFLSALRTDPVLSGLKLVAEPWDVGPGGWRTGRFPAPMAEWNDRFRNAARSFWLEAARAGSHGAPMHGLRELTTRLAGSADLFGHSDPPLMRGPVAFDHKHNEANGEDNRDGTDDNRSWNHGVEGHTPEGDDATTEPWSAVVPLRRRSQRNLLATLLLAAGTPMITAGDEMGRSQGGNNNAYAQDTAISWVDWDLDAADRELLATARYLVGLRSEHAALRAESFFLGTPRPGEDHPDLLWFGTDGVLMDAEAWAVDGRRLIQMLRPGPGDDEADVLCVLHGGLEDVVLTLPEPLEGAGPWQRVWSSTWDTPDGPEQADEEETPGTALVESLSVEVFVARR